MLNKINKELLFARKKSDKERLSAFTLLKTELINNSKSKKPLEEDKVLQSYMKRLKKSAESFQDTPKYSELLKEIEIIQELLPKEMSDDELIEFIDQWFADNPDYEAAGIGPVIGFIRKGSGSNNGKLISQEVKKRF